MKKYITLTLLFISTSLFCQWSYESGKTDFDGKYKTSSVRGKGGEYPYQNPLFVINKFDGNGVNFYITDAGYSGCSSKKIFLKFEGDEEIYETENVIAGRNKDSWFIDEIKSLSDGQFVSKLKKHSFLSVRLKSSCGQTDYRFTLKGSTAALNYVLGKEWERVQEEKDELQAGRMRALAKQDSIEKQERILARKLKRKEDSLWFANLESKRVAKKVKDSLDKIQLAKNKKEDAINFAKKCADNKKYIQDKNAKCFMFNEKGKFYKNMQSTSSTKVERGTILYIDLDFKNKVYYKVIFIEEFGKVNFYSPKKVVYNPSL